MADFDTTPTENPIKTDDQSGRPTFGFVACGLIFAALIALGLVSYFSSMNVRNSALSTIEAEYRAAVISGEMKRYLPMPGADKKLPPGVDPGAKDEGTKRTSYQELLGKLESYRKDDVLAAALYASIQTELGNPVDEPTIKLLKTATKIDDAEIPKERIKVYRAMAEVYAPTKLSSNRAKEIVGVLGETRFVDRMARVHAMAKAGNKEFRATVFDKRKVLAPVFGGVLLILILLAGSTILIVYVLVRKSGKPALGHPMEPLTFLEANDLATRVALILLVFLAVPLISHRLLGDSSENQVASAVTSLLLAAGAVIIARMKTIAGQYSWQRLGLDLNHLPRHILWGIGGALAVWPILVTVTFLSNRLLSGLPAPIHPTTTELQMDKNPMTVLSVLILASVCAPVIEEILFRGLLTPALGKIMKSPITGSLVASFLFAAIHPQGITGWAGLMAIAGVATVLAYQTKSIVPSIIMHSTHNFITLASVLLIF